MPRYRAIDKSTGEYYETDYDSLDELREAYAALEQEMAAKKRLLEKMKTDIKAFMGDETEFDVGNGYSFKKIFSEFKNYEPYKVQRIVDEFDITPTLLMSPDKQKIEVFLKDQPSREISARLTDALEVTQVRESLKFIKPDDVIKQQGGKTHGQESSSRRGMA